MAQPLASHHRRDDLEGSTYVIQERAVSEGKSGPDGKGWRQGQAYTLESRHHQQAVTIARPITASSYKGHDEDTDTIVTHSLTGEGHDAGEDGTGRGTPIVMQDGRGSRNGDLRTDSLAFPLIAAKGQSEQQIVAPTLRVGGREQGAGSSSDNTPIVAATVRTHNRNNSDPATEARALVAGVRPRRLTPRECERLQGFPNDWTLVEGASDSARYRALGNAVAVPVVEWILRRMSKV